MVPSYAAWPEEGRGTVLLTMWEGKTSGPHIVPRLVISLETVLAIYVIPTEYRIRMLCPVIQMGQ